MPMLRYMSSGVSRKERIGNDYIKRSLGGRVGRYWGQDEGVAAMVVRPCDEAKRT